jgi:hypothetical protein
MNLLSLEPLPFALALVILALLVAGCGGSRSSALYGLNATLTCLQGKGLPAFKESSTAAAIPLSEGKPDINVPYGDQDIYVIFESSADEARATSETINDASYAFALDGVTTTNGNAMIFTREGILNFAHVDEISACLHSD